MDHVIGVTCIFRLVSSRKQLKPALDCKRYEAPAHVFRKTLFRFVASNSHSYGSIWSLHLQGPESYGYPAPQFLLSRAVNTALQRAAWNSARMEVSAMAKSILIADDQEAIRRMLCFLFASESDFEVCGEAENGQEALEMAQVLHPDLILLDLSMPVMNGIEAACELKRVMPMTPIIVFSEFSDVFSEREARKAGISACVSKAQAISVLLDRAREVLYPLAA